jgi:hypothetical protein
MAFPTGQQSPQPVTPMTASGSGRFRAKASLAHPRRQLPPGLHKLQDEMTPGVIAKELREAQFLNGYCLLGVDEGVRDYLLRAIAELRGSPR